METVLELLDRAEGVLRRHLGRLPADQRQAVEREVLGLLRMARAALPKELHEATRRMEEAELLLARAREEARRIVLDAQAHARSLAEGGSGRTAAVDRSASADDRGALADARREAESIRRGADEYAAAVLARLETELEKVLGTIRRGQEVLRVQDARGRRPG